MQEIKKLRNDLKDLERGFHFKRFRKMMREALSEQIEDFVKQSGFFPYWRLTKALSAESDSNLKNDVEAKLEPFYTFVSEAAVFETFLIYSNIGGQRYLDKMGIDETFDLVDDSLLDRLRDRETLLIGKKDPATGRLMGRGLLDDTTRDYIAGVLRVGLQEGKSNFEIREELLKNNSSFSEMRAEMIANAELSNQINSMELETAKQNGSTEKEWITTGDNRVTELCKENHSSSPIDILSLFPSGHQKPPRFPRCRCHLEYNDPILDENFWFGSTQAVAVAAAAGASVGQEILTQEEINQ